MGMRFLKDEVKHKMTAKEAKRKVSPKPIVSSGKMLEYEQESRAYKKKAKELRRKRNQRQGNNAQSSDDDDDNKEQSQETYTGNFAPVKMSKATKKKKKRLAKKRKAERKQKKAKDTDSESSHDSNSSSDSSEDDTPKVRYGKNMKSKGGRMKFNGIKSMKKLIKKRDSTQSPNSPP